MGLNCGTVNGSTESNITDLCTGTCSPASSLTFLAQFECIRFISMFMIATEALILRFFAYDLVYKAKQKQTCLVILATPSEIVCGKYLKTVA